MVYFPPTPTVDTHDKADLVVLAERAPSSSDPCKHSNAHGCTKPVAENSLTIALAVVIPVVVIMAILGFFLYKNYRKDKKEAMEHDPDFDENGEATALPDFPKGRPFPMEDPFHNRNSVRYPQSGFNRSTPSLVATTHGDPYLDNFVLPYHHQTGSKVSLDDYARNFGSNPGYSNRVSVARTRDSSLSGFHVPNLLSIPTNTNTNTSPQKSHLRKELLENSISKSPVKRVGDREYTNIPNVSTPSFRHDVTTIKLPGDAESTSSEDDEKDHSSEGLIHHNSEKFAVSYENESDNLRESSSQSFESVHNDHRDRSMNDQSQSGSRSPFDDNDPHTIDTTAQTADLIEGVNTEKKDARPNKELEKQVPRPVSDYADDDDIEGDFDFSTTNNTSHQTVYEVTGDDLGNMDNDYEDAEDAEDEGEDEEEDEDEVEDEDSGRLHVPSVKPRSRSPRISAFNLLKNDSDDENEDLSPEQLEEIKRMKSVYKVYFDKDNENNGQFKLEDHPLPNIDLKGQRINKHLNMDTDYSKRLTTTSSIYNENPIYPHEEQYYYQPEETQFQEQYYQDQGYPEPEARPLPPLQKLRNASDIRHSTLQTYTDFQPRSKNAAQANSKLASI